MAASTTPIPEAYIYEAIRTPRGRGKASGSLYEVKPIALVVGLIHELRRRFPTLDPAAIDDVVLGVVTPVGDQGGDIARAAALAAGLPDTVAGVQLNRFCASGLEAVNTAAMKVRSGMEDLVLAGGVESMSRVPMGSDGGAWAMDPETAYDTGFVPQGIGADLIATLEGYSRTDVDTYAVESQTRAAKAWANGWFARSVVPVRDRNGLTVLERDEHLRPGATLDALAGLTPSFASIGEAGGFDAVALQRYHWVERIEHVHHAGNSSGIVDGAALVLVGNEAAGSAAGLAPRARIVSVGLSGSDPTIMLTGPGPGQPQGAGQGRPHRRRHRSLRGQRGVRGRAHAVHARDGRAAREGQRQRRRHRHGPPAGRHRGDDPRHAARRAGTPRAALRAGDPLRRRRHGHRDDRGAGMTSTGNAVRWERGEGDWPGSPSSSWTTPRAARTR